MSDFWLLHLQIKETWNLDLDRINCYDYLSRLCLESPNSIGLRMSQVDIINPVSTAVTGTDLIWGHTKDCKSCLPCSEALKMMSSAHTASYVLYIRNGNRRDKFVMCVLLTECDINLVRESCIWTWLRPI